MYDDPIVKEVRKAGQALMEEADGSVEIFFRNLKEFQKQYSDRLVRSIPKKQMKKPDIKLIESVQQLI